jgi:predicted DNA-binding transcriptional regulator YafY
LDGDDYSDDTYRENFRLILDAIRNKYPLSIEIINGKGKPRKKVLIPEYLEYSEKDDKFRLIGAESRFEATINLGRIISCKPYEKPYVINIEKRNAPRSRSVILELIDERNALDRVLLHFAHFEKRAERLDHNKYQVTIFYDQEDEKELVIRVLSFGPMVKVTAPQHFVELIKEKLINQKSCGQ